MSTTRRTALQTDWILLAAALCLVAFGLTMVLSASGIMAEKFYSDKYFFFKRQILFAMVGGGLMAVCASLPRKVLYQLQYPVLFGALLLVILTLTPLGVNINGARRWIALGPFTVQPMEFVKIALVLYLAYFLSTKQELVKTFSKGVIPPFFVTGLICLLLLMQPDFGAAAVLSMLLFFMCLVGGTRLIYLIVSALLAGGAGWLLIVQSPYRSRRLLAFLDPFKDAQDTGYQLVQSLYAMGSGGIAGQGLGAGKQKLFFLPEAHNDFIMAVVGEEMGFVGVSLFFIIMGVMLWRGFVIAYRQDDLRDRLTSFGLTLVLTLGAVFNLAVVMGAAPPKGVAMPFMSYGGSSLLSSFLCVGLLLNFSRTAEGSPAL
ncbi:putative lipid II flippase FtsW [Desulfovibrio psychrotolerans]|uniref:Probable peptidoglycan glycosyltransferase FtsW n=1 Tax=Desulfovibrio psychrotolerans TaxID=415242 RepID=A0A7J0BSH6_9BACT|nr:putative lipid II flippase FtsW [Desulfovibrio psychrotolerans]GFM36673.1 cell division protein FtsW [Desulfovibrio psychrotolerans]